MEALEAKLAALEASEAAAATASGMAAISGAILSLCESGSHIVAPRAPCTRRAPACFASASPRFGVTTTFVDAPEAGAYARAITPATRVLYIETPSNPVLGIADIQAIVGLAKAHGLHHDRRQHVRDTVRADAADAGGRPGRSLDDQGARRPRRRHRRGHLRRDGARPSARVTHWWSKGSAGSSRRSPRTSSRAGSAPSPSGSGRRASRPQVSRPDSRPTRASRLCITRRWPRIPATPSRRRRCTCAYGLDPLVRAPGRRRHDPARRGAPRPRVGAHDHPRGQPRRRPLAPHAPRLDDALHDAESRPREGGHLGRPAPLERRDRVDGRSLAGPRSGPPRPRRLTPPG